MHELQVCRCMYLCMCIAVCVSVCVCVCVSIRKQTHNDKMDKLISQSQEGKFDPVVCVAGGSMGQGRCVGSD